MDEHFSGHRGPNDEWIWDEPPTSGRPVSRSPRLRFHLRVPPIRWPGRPRLPEFRPPNLRLPILRRPALRWPGRPPLPAFRLPYLHAPRLPSLHLPSVRLSPLPRGYAPVESAGGKAEAKTARQHPYAQAVLLTSAAIAVLIISTALLALAFAGGSTILPPVIPTSSALTPGPTGVGPASPPALGLWDKAQRAWVFGNISDRAGYKEGDRMPFLVRWTGAQRDTTYEVTLQYDCHTGDGAAIDFLSGLPAGDEGPATAQFGPGRFRPDGAIPLPDDTSLAFDDATSAVLQSWGGTFAQLARGPTPDGVCTGQKSVVVQIKATSDTVYLLGSMHLAAAADWSGRGASAQNGPFTFTVSVARVGVVNLGVLPHAVTR